MPSHPKANQQLKEVGVMGQFQVAFCMEVLYKCNQFYMLYDTRKAVKHCVAAMHK